MPPIEFRKRAAYFFAFSAAVALVLILFPFFEDWAVVYLTAQFGLTIGPDGTVTNLAGDAPSKMTETTVNLLVSLLRIIKILLWMTLVISLVRLVSLLVTRTIYRNSTPGEISSILKTVISIIVYIVSFFVIFQSQFPSVQLAPLFTGSTIIGIVVGLALQDTLGNLFAGLALQADQPFQVGDVILISNRGEGVVESVSWRGVKIRTFQNKLVVISNSVLGKETIEVAPKDNLNAKAVFFNTQYNFSPSRTIQVVRDAVRQVDNVAQKMRPVVRIRNLGDSGIEWEVKYWLDDYTLQHDTDALIRQRIWYVFNREGIEFAYPTRTVHLEAKPEEAAPDEVFNSITESLNRVTIFNPLSDSEIESLANSATVRVYAPGEPIVRMGQEGGSMFVICRGSVEVQIPERGVAKTVNKLGENDYFGEMSLLTGEPRSANVVAGEETEVLRIDKSGLQPILENNLQLVESISELMAERKELLKTKEEDGVSVVDTRSGVMRSIRSFFGLGGG